MNNYLKYLLLTASLCVSALSFHRAEAQSLRDTWNDPEFVKRFLGTYGFLPEIEPKIKANEVELLRSLIDTIRSNPQAAISRLQSDINSDSSAALEFVVGNLYAETGDAQRAIYYYQRAIEKFPAYRRAHKNLGIFSLQSQDYAAAITHLSRAIELGDREGKTYGGLGYAYRQQERYFSAEEAFRQAILQDPDEADWKQGIAECLNHTRRYQEAEALFGELITRNPSDPTYWRFQVNAYLGQEQSLQAALNLEVIRDLGKATSRDLILLGDIYLKNLEMRAKALEAFLEALKLDGKEGTTINPIIESAGLLLHFGETQSAAELVAQVRKKQSASITDKQDLKLLLLEARVAEQSGDSAEAAKTLRKIIQRDPLNGDALLELATHYIQKENYEEAEILLERAQQIEVSRFRAYVRHAEMKVYQNAYSEAVTLLKDALAIKDDSHVQEYLVAVKRASLAE